MDIEYKKIIESANEMEKLKFPRIIEIQTNSSCNGMCIVCPYKDMSIKREAMSDELLNKILNEIYEHKDSVERVIPYLNNEPSLDKRMMSILRDLKKHNMFVELSTNMSNWKEEQLEEIVKDKLVDDFRISFFGDTKELYEKMMSGLKFEKCKDKVKYILDLNNRLKNIAIQISVILLPELDIYKIKEGLNKLFDHPNIHCFGFLDRCGKVKRFNNDLAIKSTDRVIGCSLNRPFERCCINANGDVILCSQDWGKEVILGNINEESIEELWNGKKMKDIRDTILGRKQCEEDFLCNRCKLAILQNEKEWLLNFSGDKYMSSTGKKLVK